MATATQSTPARAAGRVDESKADEALMDRYIQQLGIKGAPPTAPIGLKVNRLLEHAYAADAAKTPVASCNTCGGLSIASLPECPICGDAEVDGDAEDFGQPAPAVTATVPKPEPAAKPSRKRSSVVPAAKSNGSNGSAAPATDMPVRTLAQPNAEELQAAAEPEAAEPPVAAKPAKARAAKPTVVKAPAAKVPAAKVPAAKVPAAKAAPAAKAKPTKVARPTTALALAGAPAQPHAVRKLDAAKVKALDAAKKAIQAYRADMVANFWNIGTELRKIDKAQSWRNRMVREPKSGAYVPVHSSFKGFMHDELGFSHTYGYQMMAVAERFTLAEVRKMGPSGLRVLVQLPAEQQDKAREILERGGTKRDVEQLRVPRGRNFTAVLVAGQTVLPAMAGPVVPGKPPKAATRLQDEPWALWQLENDVTIRVHLTRSANAAEPGLKFVVTVQRGGQAVNEVVDVKGEAVE